jgi:hypothetical protein
MYLLTMKNCDQSMPEVIYLLLKSGLRLYAEDKEGNSALIWLLKLLSEEEASKDKKLILSYVYKFSLLKHIAFDNLFFKNHRLLLCLCLKQMASNC